MSIIKDLLNNRENYFCNAVRAFKLREMKRIADEHEYHGRLSVGRFTSITCCPKKLVTDAQEGKRFAVKTGYKLDLGKEIHRSYQEAAIGTPNLLWNKPNMPEDVLITSKDKPPETLQQKLEKKWPELPVFLLDSEGEVAIIGYCDAVIQEYKKPQILEIKSVNSDPIDFQYKFKEACKLPDKKHILQSKIYGVIMNYHNYFEKPVKSTRLVYVNTRMEAGNDSAEREEVFPISEEDESQILKMLFEGVKQVEAFRKGIDLDCGYEFCYKHALNIKEEE